VVLFVVVWRIGQKGLESRLHGVAGIVLQGQELSIGRGYLKEDDKPSSARSEWTVAWSCSSSAALTFGEDAGGVGDVVDGANVHSDSREIV
jgi:hypothetical protein